MRLVHQSYTSPYGLNIASGVVQVCINQQYGYVCADNWDDKEADVVCRSLSFSYRAPYYGMTFRKPAYRLVYMKLLQLKPSLAFSYLWLMLLPHIIMWSNYKTCL